MKSLFIYTSIILSSISARAQKPEMIIAEHGITLPTLPKSLGNYRSIVRIGNLIYLSGKGPIRPDGKYVTGRVGKDVDIKQGYNAARLCGIAQLAALKAELGDLSKVKRIVNVIGFVNASDTFTDHPKVVDGYSDLMTEVLGDKGSHTRSAVGVASLPGGWPIEVSMVVEIEP